MRLVLEHNYDLLEPWFEDLLAWKDLDLSVANQRWVCLSEVPLFLWHSEFSARVGEELGELVRLFPRCWIDRKYVMFGSRWMYKCRCFPSGACGGE